MAQTPEPLTLKSIPLEHPQWMSVEDIAYANYVLRLDFATRKKHTSLTKIFEKPPTYMNPSLLEIYKEHVNEEIETEKKRINKLLIDALNYLSAKYYHVAYLASILNKVALAVAALPPQYTLLSYKQYRLHTSTYINTAFIPITIKQGNKMVKKQGNVLAKYVMSYYAVWRKYHLKKYLEKTPMMKKFYQRKLTQYVNAGKSESHAKKLASRDVLRILIGNAWLIQMYYLLRDGLIDAKDVELPYHIAANPNLHKDMIKPIDTLTNNQLATLPKPLREELDNIVWEWIVNAVIKS